MPRTKQRTPAKASRSKRRGVSSGADAPLYRVVLQTIRERIVAGTYPVGTQLPTEGELAEEFGVSRHTIREALRKLRYDGLVYSRQGAGTTVKRQGAPEPYVHEISSINDIVTYAAETQYRADSTQMIVADEALAQRLGCPVGQRWLRIEGVRYEPDGTTPLSWTEAYVNSAYAGVALMLGRRSGAIYSWIEDMYGERIAEVDQRIKACIVPDEYLEVLQVKPGSAGLDIRRTYRLSDGTVAEVSLNLYPEDRYSYSMTLRRARQTED